MIPEYSRVNRIIRDIPSSYIKAGNKRSSLRQDIHNEMDKRGTQCRCIRCREIRGRSVAEESLTLNDLCYHPQFAEEHFLNYSTDTDHLAGYLRLSLPQLDTPAAQAIYQQVWSAIPELKDCAIIREVHIYGQSLQFGAEKNGAAQHVGLGSTLIEKAAALSQERGFSKLAVIAAIGTRQYYKERGFTGGNLYMIRDL
jgi:elongator complex protein 3